MSVLSRRPMRLLNVEFKELHARHLCRHSQLGINVAHLIALFGTWYALYGLLYWLLSWISDSIPIAIEWLLLVPAGVYLAALVPNLPPRVFAATCLFLAFALAAVVWLPAPFWVYLLMIPVFYKLQSWSHTVFTVETDMTEFNRKYTKGSVLFVVLLLYEVPIVLNYLLFERTAENALAHAASIPTCSQETAGAKAP
jgi:hypothetical protein